MLSWIALTGAALASVRNATATAQADNVLRYDVTVSTSEIATVAVQVWKSGSAPSTGWTTAYTTTQARNHTLDLWGLEPSTAYNFRVLVDVRTGTDYTDTRIRRFTTAALPSGLPVVTATTLGGTPDAPYVLFDTRRTDTGDGALIIADTAGRVRWYQTAPSGEHYYAVWQDPADQSIYAILEQDRVIRYAMDGTTTLDWSMADVLQDYVHHEVVVHDGVLYVLTARAYAVGPTTYVEDGIQGYDSAGNLVYEWWARDGGLSLTANAPYASERAGFFASIWIGARDWTHANSLDIEDEGGSLKAYLSFRQQFQVAKVDLATGAVEWLLGQNPSGSSDALGDFSMDPTGVDPTWWSIQHHAHYEDDGTFLLFDNSTGTVSRALELSIDEAGGEVRVGRSVDLLALADGTFTGSCERESGVFRRPSGHLLITCGPEMFAADVDSSDTLTWVLDVAASYATYRFLPVDDIGL